jgi:predicted ester cyclase
MSADQQTAIFRRLIDEGFNQGRLDVVDACFPPTFIEHQYDMSSTREGLKHSIQFLREHFAPFSLTIEALVVDGDTVWARMIGRGTDSTGLMGRPPTGRSFAITVMDVCRFADGTIVEHWGVPDRLHQLAQLGLWAPEAGQAG